MQTKQMVTREVEEVVSTTCNACGQTKSDTTHVHASGGYESTALFDMQHYEFDLCEECIVTVMMGLKIPPLVTGESWGEEPLTWENDRAHFKKSHERSAAQEQAEQAAQEAGVCGRRSYINGQYSDKLCGTKPAMRVNFYGRGFEPVCLSHGTTTSSSGSSRRRTSRTGRWLSRSLPRTGRRDRPARRPSLLQRRSGTSLRFLCRRSTCSCAAASLRVESPGWAASCSGCREGQETPYRCASRPWRHVRARPR